MQKDLIYKDRPTTRDAMKELIRRACAVICRNVLWEQFRAVSTEKFPGVPRTEAVAPQPPMKGAPDTRAFSEPRAQRLGCAARPLAALRCDQENFRVVKEQIKRSKGTHINKAF